MQIEGLILNKIKKQGKLRTVEIIKKTGFSRAYINRFFQKLSQEGKIIAITQGRSSYYVLADKDQINKIKRNKKQYNIKGYNQLSFSSFNHGLRPLLNPALEMAWVAVGCARNIKTAIKTIFKLVNEKPS